MYSSRVESRSLRRRASLLRTLTVAPLKPKIRHLILTSLRILTVKPQKRRAGGSLTIKAEFMLRQTDRRDKEKETRVILVNAVAKGEREFVLLTVCDGFSIVPIIFKCGCDSLPNRTPTPPILPQWRRLG
jgi:hypothetical protein